MVSLLNCRFCSSPIFLTPIRQHGFSLIAVIGILAVVTIGLSLVTPAFIQIWNQQHQDQEGQQLLRIAEGIHTFLKQNKSFPPSLVSLSPDYVPFATTQISTNSRGFPRYYVVHPSMAGFTNRLGLTAAELPDTRILLITNLTQDAAPNIITPADFETWWAMDESVNPNLHIHRTNVGHLFFSLTITPEGNGASYFIDSIPSTDSGGGLLPVHNVFHLMGTTVGFDEATTYTAPEVQFSLTTNVDYWFDPLCSVNKQWNPLDPDCGSTGITLWLTTAGGTAGTPGITWTDSELVAFDEPNLTYDYGPTTTTSGTFSQRFNLENFTGNADVDAVHYVRTAITTGGISFAVGDLLLSTTANETLTSDNTLFVRDEDIFSFRPTTPGDYSSGTFTRIIDGSDMSLGDIEAITLVELQTDVGGTTLAEGSFLWVDSSRDVYEFIPTTLGGTTTGTATLFIDGSDIRISRDFFGLELIESAITVGDANLISGQILATLERNDGSVGDNGITTRRNDIFILDLTSTGPSTAGNATLFFDGSDVSMTTGGENTNGFAIVPPP